MNGLERFIERYSNNLRQAVIEHPEEYDFPVEHTPVVVGKMEQAFKRGSYNKDGRAIKATCKELGIKYTYTAINEFIRAA